MAPATKSPTLANPCVIDQKAGTVTLVLPLEGIHLSSSGKNLMVASSHGPVRTSVLFKDRPVTFSVNAYVKATPEEKLQAHGDDDEPLGRVSWPN